VFLRDTSGEGFFGKHIRIKKGKSTRRERDGHYRDEGVKSGLEFLSKKSNIV